MLVEREADINAQDNEGMTPLMCATRNGFLPIVKYLLSKGANVTIQNNYGSMALSIAIVTNRQDLISSLKSVTLLESTAPHPLQVLWETIVTAVY